MNEPSLRASVAEALDIPVDELGEDTELETLPTFDSTSRLSLMVCLSDFTGQPLELCSLRELRTYRDILNLVKVTKG